jgi:formate dehydrogenase subunit gamma
VVSAWCSTVLVPGWGVTRGEMQIGHIVHALSSVLMMALFLGHIYMAVLGVPGAMHAMKTGFVDESWAQGAPRTLVRRRQGRQDPGRALADAKPRAWPARRRPRPDAQANLEK